MLTVDGYCQFSDCFWNSRTSCRCVCSWQGDWTRGPWKVPFYDSAQLQNCLFYWSQSSKAAAACGKTSAKLLPDMRSVYLPAHLPTPYPSMHLGPQVRWTLPRPGPFKPRPWPGVLPPHPPFLAVTAAHLAARAGRRAPGRGRCRGAWPARALQSARGAPRAVPRPASSPITLPPRGGRDAAGGPMGGTCRLQPRLWGVCGGSQWAGRWRGVYLWRGRRAGGQRRRERGRGRDGARAAGGELRGRAGEAPAFRE